MAKFLGDNYESIYAAFRPVNNTAARMAAKDREFQLLSYIEEQEAQKTTRTQQQIQLQEQWQAQVDALEFEAPDKQRLKSLFLEKKKEMFKRIKDNYQGDWQTFLNAEGVSSAQKMLTEVMSSDLFSLAKSNKENVALAKKAVMDGKNLIGGIDAKTGLYRYAEQDLEAFQSGARPTFEYKGAYDPKEGAKVQEYFSKMDNPFGKFNNDIGVPEAEKLMAAKNFIGDAGGEDFYYRSLSNRPMFYKRQSPEELQKFQMDLAKSAASTASAYDAIRSRRFNDQLKSQKFELEKAESIGGGQSYIDMVSGIANNATKVYHYTPNSSDVNKNLSIFGRGVTLNNLATTDVAGNNQIAFHELPAPVNGDLISKAAGTYGKNPSVKELLLPTKGGAVISLQGLNYKIVSAPSTKFYMDQQSYGGNRDRAFQEVTIEMTEDAAKKAGFIDDGIIFDSKTRLGVDDTNVKNLGNGNIQITGFAGFNYNQVLDRELNTKIKGQKVSNETNYSESSFDLY